MSFTPRSDEESRTTPREGVPVVELAFAEKLERELNMSTLERDNARVLIGVQTRELKCANTCLGESEKATALALETLDRVVGERNNAVELARQLRDLLNAFVEADKKALGELAQFAPSYTSPTTLQTLHTRASVVLSLAKEVLG